MRTSRLLACLLSASFSLALVPAAYAADAEVSSTRIVVRHVAGLSAGERADLRSEADVTLVRTLPLSGFEVVRAADASSQDEALAALRSDPDVLSAEPDGIVRTASVPVPSDNLFSSQWGLHNATGIVDDDIDADLAWQLTQGAGVTVGVVDSGAQLDHADLAANLVAGHNWVSDRGTSDPTDGNGHGTHVAGIIAAPMNGTGVVGVAPQASVEPLRVLGDNGSGYNSDVAAAFAYAGDQNLKVVNASLGGATNSAAIAQAIATHPNTLYVVSAGNNAADDDTPATASYPCALPEANVVCVGASTDDDDVAYFSNYGATTVDLFAPGRSIWSTYKVGAYQALSGTSMASPMVAGTAALVAAANPSWTAAQIKARLLASVDPIATFSGLSVTGGRLNAARALGVDPLASAAGAGPVAVSGVTATGAAQSATVTWSAAGASTDHLNVFQAEDGGTPVRIDQLDPTATSYAATGLRGGHSYTFFVTAVDDDGGESVRGAGSTAAVTSAPTPPVTPAPTVSPSPPTATPARSSSPPPAQGDADDDAGSVTARLADAIRHATATTRSGKLTGVTLRLPSAATVKVVVKAGGRTLTRPLKLAAGTQKLSLAKLAGRKLPAGKVKLTLSAAGQQTTLSGRVR